MDEQLNKLQLWCAPNFRGLAMYQSFHAFTLSDLNSLPDPHWEKFQIHCFVSGLARRPLDPWLIAFALCVQWQPHVPFHTCVALPQLSGRRWCTDTSWGGSVSNPNPCHPPHPPISTTISFWLRKSVQPFEAFNVMSTGWWWREQHGRLPSNKEVCKILRANHFILLMETRWHPPKHTHTHFFFLCFHCWSFSWGDTDSEKSPPSVIYARAASFQHFLCQLTKMNKLYILISSLEELGIIGKNSKKQRFMKNKGFGSSNE